MSFPTISSFILPLNKKTPVNQLYRTGNSADVLVYGHFFTPHTIIIVLISLFLKFKCLSLAPGRGTKDIANFAKAEISGQKANNKLHRV